MSARDDEVRPVELGSVLFRLRKLKCDKIIQFLCMFYSCQLGDCMCACVGWLAIRQLTELPAYLNFVSDTSIDTHCASVCVSLKFIAIYECDM